MHLLFLVRLNNVLNWCLIHYCLWLADVVAYEKVHSMGIVCMNTREKKMVCCGTSEAAEAAEAAALDDQPCML